MEEQKLINRLTDEFERILAYFALSGIPLRFVSEPNNQNAGDFFYDEESGKAEHIRINLARIVSEEMGVFVLAHEARHYIQLVEGRMEEPERKYHFGLPDELFSSPEERYRTLYTEVDANAFAGWWVSGRLEGKPDPTFTIRSDRELRVRSLGNRRRYLAMARKRHATYAVYPKEMEGVVRVGE